jgi:oligoribonuclease NrnB/cAMP/cGMP phosphodiesterase (DHH superfamily)
MNESLIDADRLPLARKSILPGTGFFTPDDDDQGPDAEQVAALARAEVVVIADGDADGLGCTALIRDAHDDVTPPTVDPTDPVEDIDLPEGHVALIPTAPHSLTDAQLRVIEYAPEDVTVYVCDLCPDRDSDIEPLSALVEHADDVHWFDHHQWDSEYERRVRETGVDLVVGESDEECSTDVTLRSLDYSFDPRFEELAAVTRDHDLWLREDPRSDDLADFGHWVASEIYVATVRKHGVDLPEPAQEYIKERRIEKQMLIEKAVERAEMRDVAGITVGITYGRCSQNEVAQTLREQGADAAVIVKPSGSASIRGTETFKRCHEVAAQVGGGGHPKAAGCKPEIYDDMLDYAHHWTTRGAVAKQMILDAFRTLPSEDNETEHNSDS